MRSFRPAVREIAARGVRRIGKRAPVDIVASLTYEYPAYVLFHVLGVPEADVPQVKSWAGNRITLYYGHPSAEEQIDLTRDLVPFWTYVVSLVAEKNRNPQDDLTSDLIRMRAGDDSRLTLNEIASCMITLLVAGHETTTAQINNALLHLLRDRAHWERLCAAPETIPGALEEMMRFDPSVCAWRRRTTRASRINGVDIPADVDLLLMLNAANRDEDVFPEPDENHQRPGQFARSPGLRLRHSLLRRRAPGPAGDGDSARSADARTAGHAASAGPKNRIYAQHLFPWSAVLARHLVDKAVLAGTHDSGVCESRRRARPGLAQLVISRTNKAGAELAPMALLTTALV